MEFFILRDSEITFSPPWFSSDTHELIVRGSNVLEAEITTTATDDGAENQNYFAMLTSALTGGYKSYRDTLNWKIGVYIFVPNPAYVLPPPTSRPLDPTIDRHSNGLINIDPINSGKTSFLTSLYNIFEAYPGYHVTLNIFVSSFGLKNRSEGENSLISWNVRGLRLDEDQASRSLMQTVEEKIGLVWSSDQELSGRISISVDLNNSALSILDTISTRPDSRFADQKKMLNDEICSNLVIIVGDEDHRRCIKCHREFLAVGSDVFRRMFESGMSEATGNTIKMEGISELGVGAMLAYMYYRCTKRLHESSETSLEALQAAQKYNIQNLKETVGYIIMAKKASWFGVDMVFTLYMFSRALCAQEEEIKDEDDGIDMRSGRRDDDEKRNYQDNMWDLLKIRSLKVLKWYYQNKSKTLLESAKYQEIFGGDPKLGKEITSAIRRLK